MNKFIQDVIKLVTFRGSPESLPYSTNLMYSLFAIIVIIRVGFSNFEYPDNFIVSTISVLAVGFSLYLLLTMFKKKERFVKIFTSVLVAEFFSTVLTVVFFANPLLVGIVTFWHIAILIYIYKIAFESTTPGAILFFISLMVIQTVILISVLPSKYLEQMRENFLEQVQEDKVTNSESDT